MHASLAKSWLAEAMEDDPVLVLVSVRQTTRAMFRGYKHAKIQRPLAGTGAPTQCQIADNFA
jgi:hypothetical protein